MLKAEALVEDKGLELTVEAINASSDRAASK
jgi:hypothetical protein